MKQQFFVFITGLLVTLGGVGGLENDGPLVDCVVVSAVGLMIMWVGTIMIRRADRPVDNPTLW